MHGMGIHFFSFHTLHSENTLPLLLCSIYAGAIMKEGGKNIGLRNNFNDVSDKSLKYKDDGCSDRGRYVSSIC